MACWLYAAALVLLFPPESDAGVFAYCLLAIAMTLASVIMGRARESYADYLTVLGGWWAGMVVYALPLYLFAGVTDISRVLDIPADALLAGARITLVSVFVGGAFFEVLRHAALQHHREVFALAKTSPGPVGFYWAVPLLVGLYATNYIQSGVYAVIASGDRFAVIDTFESGRMWLIQYLMTGITIAFLLDRFGSSERMSLWAMIIAAQLAVYWLLFLSLGNRRGAIAIALVVLLLMSARGVGLRRIIAVAVAVAVLGGLIGVVRQGFGGETAGVEWLIAAANFFGEFIYPGYTLTYSIERGNPPSLELTWVTMFVEFGRAMMQGEAFLFLGQRLAEEATPVGSENIMGFAYLPITETFVNLGPAAAMLTGSIFVMSTFIAVRAIPYPWFYTVMFSCSLDANRGEFAGVVLQLLFTCVGYWITRYPRSLLGTRVSG